MTARYAWRGGSEMLLRHGEGAARTVLILPALFEEANRMRRFTVELMRTLAARGIGSVLPDLPGQGESVISLADVQLRDWRDAVAAVMDAMRADGRPVLSVALRGGALLDDGADFGWRLAPETGTRLLRDMVRATALSRQCSVHDVEAQARTAPTRLAGNLIAPSFYAALDLAVPADSGARVADIAGSKLWRAAEPGEDADMVDAAADDIVAWSKSCATF